MSGYGKSQAHLYDVEDVAPVSPSKKKNKKPASLKKIPTSSVKNVAGDPSESSTNRDYYEEEKAYAHHRKYTERTTKKEQLAIEQEERNKKRRMYLIYGGGIGLVLLIILAVLLGVLLPDKDDDDNGPTQSPTYHPNVIRYGDVVYIQNLGFDKRWLTGGHGIEGEEVYTRDVTTSNNEGEFVDPTKARWKIDRFSNIGDEDCVKYGDKVHLKLILDGNDGAESSSSSLSNELWLSGGRGEGLQFTYTRNPTTTISEQSLLEDGTYEWIIRTNFGKGSRTRAGLHFGDCIIYQDEGNSGGGNNIDAVYFQSNKLDNRWLVGSRGLFNDGVLSFDKKLDTGDFGASIEPNYQWKILKELGNGEV